MSAAIVVSLATSISSFVIPSSSTSSSLLRSSPLLRFSLAVSPLCYRIGKRNLMAHSLARATLGLTQPNSFDFPKVIPLSSAFLHTSFGWIGLDWIGFFCVLSSQLCVLIGFDSVILLDWIWFFNLITMCFFISIACVLIVFIALVFRTCCKFHRG